MARAQCTYFLLQVDLLLALSIVGTMYNNDAYYFEQFPVNLVTCVGRTVTIKSHLHVKVNRKCAAVRKARSKQRMKRFTLLAKGKRDVFVSLL